MPRLFWIRRAWQEGSKNLRLKRLSFHKARLLELGAAGRLLIAGEIDEVLRLDDAEAPDYARTVDIHRKPGYDPAELFIDPKIAMPTLRVGWTLLKRKMGMRSFTRILVFRFTNR